MNGGLVASTAAKSPLRGHCRDRETVLGLSSTAVPGLSSYRPGDVTLPVPVTSWRSGAGYTRAMSQAGRELPLSRNELLGYFGNGDKGHPYQKSEVLKMHSDFYAAPLVATTPKAVRSGSKGEIICQISPRYDRFGFSIPVEHYQYLSYMMSSPPPFAMSDSALQEKGQTLCLAYDPVQQGADLLVSLGELLMDGLPKPLARVITAAGRRGRPDLIAATAGEYLGYIFGIKPVIKDIRAILKVADGIDKVVSQWIRNNKKQVRRRRQFPVKSTATNYFSEGNGTDLGFSAWVPISSPWSPSNVISPTAPYKNIGFVQGASDISYRFSKMSITKEKLKFSAAYEYDLENLLPGDDSRHLNELSDSELKDLITLQYLGLTEGNVGGNLIWNLTPWSWMIDWFTNIGDQLDYYRKIQSVGLKVDWAYVSIVQEVWTKVSQEIFLRGAGGVYDPRQSNLLYRHNMEFRTLYVRRLKASPFGFNVNFDGLSPSQITTLAALALARTRI